MKEINKKLFAEANSLVDIILFCCCIKLSNYWTLFLDGVESGVLLSDFAQQIFSKKRRRSRHLPYFTRRCGFISNSGSESKCQNERGETGFVSEFECQKLQRLYTQGGAAFRSVLYLVKISNLSVSKVRHFLHSKRSYTKFTPATRKFKRMKAFARFKYKNLVYGPSVF